MAAICFLGGIRDTSDFLMSETAELWKIRRGKNVKNGWYQQN